MEAKIIDKQALFILGLQERFTPDNEDFVGIWKRFMEYHDLIKAYSVDGAYYGVNFAGVEHETMDYLAGMLVTSIDKIPDGLTHREIPASRYAIFQCAVKEISDTYEWIFGVWLKTAHYPRPGQDSPKADFEYYPPATDSGDTMVVLHIALED